MSEPFYGEIKAVGFTYPPRGYADCAGQIMDVSQNSALFSLLGTNYGGNGRTTFGLPNLMGRVAVGQGANYLLGYSGGRETNTLSSSQLPAHTHQLMASTAQGTSAEPANKVLANAGAAAFNGAVAEGVPVTGNVQDGPTKRPLVDGKTSAAGVVSGAVSPLSYGNPENLTIMSDAAIAANTGGGHLIDNRQPYLAIRYIIALQGL